MWSLLSESIIIGIITFVIGTIIFNLSINKSNKDEIKPYGINFAFFITGVILHIGLEVIGFNKWYCNKEVITKICRLSELGELTCTRY
jgi:hypothetical protein